MKHHLTLFAFLLACTPLVAQTSECLKIAERIEKAITANPSDLLAIVERKVAEHPTCACEIVKSAIVATEAYPDLVGQIVAASIEAAPQRLNLITTCAIAAAPDALPQVKAVLAKLAPEQKDAWKLGIGAKSGLPSAKATLAPAAASAKSPIPAAVPSNAGAKSGAKSGLSAKAPLAPKEPASRFTTKNPVDDIYLVPGLPPIHPPLIHSTCTPDQFPNARVIQP